ncbi:MAG TPA: MaoC family dehydratase N-terminal domain-containing protein [Candidatus Lustribacter sp.]|nr:MaoC family dehydratase N-terminal domain-containing protein [Candidatus Lustribacter sp.]
MVDDLESLITPDMRACLGSVTKPMELPEEISASDVRHFVSVIGETNPIYRDAAYAKRMGYKGVVVPPIFVVVLFRRLQDPEGETRVGIDWPGLKMPAGFTNTRNAGQVYKWIRPVYVGDRLTIQMRLTDFLARRTRDGRPMILVVTEYELHNQDGDLILLQTNHDAKLQPAKFQAS